MSKVAESNAVGRPASRLMLVPSRRAMMRAAALVMGMLIVESDPLHAEPPPATQPAKWQSLFDGKALGKWQVSDFAGHGECTVEAGCILLPFGDSLTGVTYRGDVPKMNYEIALEAKKIDGNDFFCGLTFPVGESFASLICGGWGGAVVGISSLDGKDAMRNETRLARNFEKGRWYAVRVRVLPDRLMAWIDQEKVVDVSTAGRKVSTRIEVEASKPLGIASYQTTSAIRNIRIRPLTAEELASPAVNEVPK